MVCLQQEITDTDGNSKKGMSNKTIEDNGSLRWEEGQSDPRSVLLLYLATPTFII